jgi:formylglycine-generating enzyme required for sulfatase activity
LTDRHDVFLSYSRNDFQAGAKLRLQLAKHGLSVFKDDESIRESELWLNRLQDEVDACGAFVVLVGRDGVRRWISAETQVALNRYFGPHEDAQRLPIFPILLSDTGLEALPAFLRLFQATPWNGADSLPPRLLDQIRQRKLVLTEITFEGCPFVGLGAYRIDQGQLFFGRQKETLDALACFDSRPASSTVRWLEINGNSGSGKSSLMNAGLLPLVDQGWLWPRTGYARWRRIGPMMPGEHALAMLAEHLARTFQEEMADIRRRLQGDDRALAEWLRGRKEEETAFLLAIDQFEELFTFSDPEERGRFDRLLAGALDDADCPLFVISTVRADFLDRFEDLPRLVAVRNRVGRPWTLAPIGTEGLREVIAGPARLAGLDVSEVQEAMVAEARDEPGALPLVENALHWLWEKRTGNRLSGQLFTDQGGLAGILSGSADVLLAGLNKQQQGRALELLFRLVKVDPDSRRHTRRRIPLAEAIGGDERGRAVVDRLAGQRRRDGGTAEGPLRLITVTEEGGQNGSSQRTRWANLIHETLIRSRGLDANGKMQPYWPTLWNYIEKNKQRAARWERLQLLAREWKDRKGLARLHALAGWSALFGFRGLAARGSLEQRYLRWSRSRALAEVIALVVIMGVIGEGVYWGASRRLPLDAVIERWTYKFGLQSPPVPAFVKIPAGSFMMGSERTENERPPHRVQFSQPFYMGETEVTFHEWDACIVDSGCDGYRPADEWGRGPQPVINVSWNDAQAYVRWLSKKKAMICRLPSEAEWEYAARAKTTSDFALPAPGGSDDIKGKNLANCADCGSKWDGRQTAPVGSFPRNGWGLQDMHGNVWEWVEDCWHGSYEDAPQTGKAWLKENGGDCVSRVLRGGSWYNDRDFARSAFRNWYFPNFRNYFIGFRVVCSSPSSGTEH